MAKAFELIGKKFGLLTVVSRVDNDQHGNTRWLCNCKCGNTAIVKATKLTCGRQVSCGCNRHRRNDKSRTRLYQIWRNMHGRCENPKRDHYDRYGGRGIEVCSEWKDFETFERWAIENGYAEDLSIDRIDVNGNYTPENCRWANRRQQCNNRSSNHLLEFRGTMYTIAQFAEKMNVPYHTIRNHIKAGWSTERMFEYHAREQSCGNT